MARLLAERLGCTTEFLLHGIEPRQRIDTELGLRHAELELRHGDPNVAAERFTEIIKAAGEENALLAAHARLGRARALEAQGRLGPAVEAYERLRREAAAHPERLADLPLTVALSRCYHLAGDRLRARDLGTTAFEQASRLAVTQGELAVDLAAALVETRSDDSAELAYVRQVLAATGFPEVVDRSAEIHALWKASIVAARVRTPRWPYGWPTTPSPQVGRLVLRCASGTWRWSGPGSASPSAEEAEEFAVAATRILSAFADTVADHAESLIVHGRVRLRAGDATGAAELGAMASRCFVTFQERSRPRRTCCWPTRPWPRARGRRASACGTGAARQPARAPSTARTGSPLAAGGSSATCTAGPGTGKSRRRRIVEHSRLPECVPPWQE
ncbi:tetratricopeptide repeat protein [Nonomuraea dietziae]|uniref:tetratricopeptide repeat protein n=1 Tax=Nonomuraea dietziae TaxID=65515 RepID=UPI0031DB5997